MKRRLSRREELRIALIPALVTFGPAMMVWPLNRLLGRWTPPVGAMLLALGVGLLFRYVLRLALRLEQASESFAASGRPHARGPQSNHSR